MLGGNSFSRPAGEEASRERRSGMLTLLVHDDGRQQPHRFPGVPSSGVLLPSRYRLEVILATAGGRRPAEGERRYLSFLPPTEMRWEKVRRYIRPSATAGVLWLPSPRGLRPRSSKRFVAASTTTSPSRETP